MGSIIISCQHLLKVKAELKWCNARGDQIIKSISQLVAVRGVAKGGGLRALVMRIGMGHPVLVTRLPTLAYRSAFL